MTRPTRHPKATFLPATLLAAAGVSLVNAQPFPIVDTGQDACYDANIQITDPLPGDAYYGQDAQHAGAQPSYAVSADGLTVLDNVTGLTWTRTADWDGDGNTDTDDKLSFADAQAFVAALNAQAYGGHTDWRLPTTKQLYSLIDFRGLDPDPMASSSTGLTPFIDESVFGFAYGDYPDERIIDSQWVVSTVGVNDDGPVMFGVNFADGRIKGYPTVGGPGGSDKLYNMRFCRGAESYGENDLVDNADGTVTDLATGLMWTQSDNGAGMDWPTALAWVEQMNDAQHLGYSDWRLPNAKELQGIVDYTRSPQTTGSAAIDPVFSTSEIVNLAGQADWPFFWTSTTHLSAGPVSAGRAVYVCFGRGMGTWNGVSATDVHGAGSQRSDPKLGNPASYPNLGNGPQGDTQRVFNHVRLVRDAAPEPLCPGDVDGDGDTDVFDFADLATNFGAGPGAARIQGDLNGDGMVDVFDFSDLASDFGCDTN